VGLPQILKDSYSIETEQAVLAVMERTGRQGRGWLEMRASDEAAQLATGIPLRRKQLHVVADMAARHLSLVAPVVTKCPDGYLSMSNSY
jgi:hypothetical protein